MVNHVDSFPASAKIKSVNIEQICNLRKVSPAKIYAHTVGQTSRPDYALGVSAAVEEIAGQRTYYISDGAIPHLQIFNTTRMSLWRCNSQPGMVTC